MKKIKKYLKTEGYEIDRRNKHWIFKNRIIKRTITVSSTPLCETQELKLVKQIVRRYKRQSQVLTV